MTVQLGSHCESDWYFFLDTLGTSLLQKDIEYLVSRLIDEQELPVWYSGLKKCHFQVV